MKWSLLCGSNAGRPWRRTWTIPIVAIGVAALVLGCGAPGTPTTPPPTTPLATAPPPTTPPPTAPPPTTPPPTAPLATQLLSLLEKFARLKWVAYAPTHYDPGPKSGAIPSNADIQDDLSTLYQVGFRGLVTYGASGALADIPLLARKAGFEGVVMGIWTPGDPQETEAAVKAASYVDGYAVGNEGLYFSRYDVKALGQAITDLRKRTGKPVSTTEPLSVYYKEGELLKLGDWVFPNAHPFWRGFVDPFDAVKWTKESYDSLKKEAGDGEVVFKEVGLPTAGKQQLSENRQALYYARLRDTPVRFVYFEAFDQPWKTEEGVGAHWGLFKSDRSQKEASKYAVRGYPPFYVYANKGSPDNHFVAQGWMGSWEGVSFDDNDKSNVFSGTSAIRITYVPKPEFAQKWAGIYWWHPPQQQVPWYEKRGGFDLTGWTRLTFWAKGANGGEVAEFKVGGLKDSKGQDADSLQPPVTTYALSLPNQWTNYSMSLYGRDLSNVAGGFVWVTDAKQETTIYIDEIRFEWSEGR